MLSKLLEFVHLVVAVKSSMTTWIESYLKSAFIKWTTKMSENHLKYFRAQGLEFDAWFIDWVVHVILFKKKTLYRNFIEYNYGHAAHLQLEEKPVM